MVVGMGSVLLTIDRHRARATDVAVLGGQVRTQSGLPQLVGTCAASGGCSCR